MLHAIVLKLRASGPFDVPPAHGHHAHGLFLRIIQSADPELSQRLHDLDERKPFTVSALGSDGAGGRPRHVDTETPIWLRVTLLDDELFGPFIARFLRPGASLLRLGKIELTVEEVIPTADGHRLAGYSEYGRVLECARPHRQIDLRFAAPAAFSMGRRRMELLPRPELVFNSLLQDWNTFAPEHLRFEEDVRRRAEESCVVSRYDLRTEIFQFPRHPQSGFLGFCRFSLLGDDEDLRHTLNALADFAFYAGVGYKTTMGMGQTYRVVSQTREDHGR